MTLSVWIKLLVPWFGILVLAVLNGILREKMLIPVLGTSSALIASGAILCFCIFAVTFVVVPWYGRLPSAQWLLIGLFWLLLTLIFEFAFGRFIQGKPWRELLAAYTFEGGNIWPLVLVAMLLAPWLMAKWRGLV